MNPEKNFDKLKNDRWYRNLGNTCVVKIIGERCAHIKIYVSDNQSFAEDGDWLYNGGNKLHPNNLVFEMPEGWEPVVADNATSKPWPDRYEVGMRFERANGEVVECGFSCASYGEIGGLKYAHGKKDGLIGELERNILTKWLNPPTATAYGNERVEISDLPKLEWDQPKPDRLDRDEVLRVATALLSSLLSNPQSGADITHEMVVRDAVHLIQAVNERCEGYV